MSDWLVKRLAPMKRKEDRWVSFAAALEQVWEEFIDPPLSRLERLRSYFLADIEDLARKLREMGDYFSRENPYQDDRPIAVSWRRLELQYKDLELILTYAFRRHFRNLTVEWMPIFAPLKKEYGEEFILAEVPWPETNKNQPPAGMFLTSRGRLGVDAGYLLRLRLPKADFEQSAMPLLRRIKPEHIVFDGLLYYIYIPIFFPALDFTVSSEQEAVFPLLFNVGNARFDYTAADVRPVDTNGISCEAECDQKAVIPFWGSRERQLWRLDWHMPEGFPPGWVPLEFVLAGCEGELITPLRAVLHDVRRTRSLVAVPCDLNFSAPTKDRDPLYSSMSAALMDMREPEADADYSMEFCPPTDSPPFHLAFDVVPADFCPLDMTFGGLRA